ncbi:hypothetical protein Mgra_00001761 [Meloidogyne graminicola]|uniref:Uncharacterized protein n=1 Tax=Meloidogyne graminicola TaxID=189291 RepID=A0A8T0A008_9BILA|nr:hypothetical protein Mgra_00001761 [Meloidogyne graminicola]
MDFIDLVESSPEPYDDNRNPAFQMDGSRTVRADRSVSRIGNWRINNSHNSMAVPGEFGYARRSRVEDYTDSIGNVPVTMESKQFFNRSTNERSFFENRLSEGNERDRGIFEREKRRVHDNNERIDTGGYFSLGLKQQLLHRNPRSTNNELSHHPDVNETLERSHKRQSLPPIVSGNRKRQFFEDPIPTSSGRLSSLQPNDSHLTPIYPPKQARFSFVSVFKQIF